MKYELLAPSERQKPKQQMRCKRERLKGRELSDKRHNELIVNMERAEERDYRRERRRSEQRAARAEKRAERRRERERMV
jgi:hypothetical protein